MFVLTAFEDDYSGFSAKTLFRLRSYLTDFASEILVDGKCLSSYLSPKDIDHVMRCRIDTLFVLDTEDCSVEYVGKDKIGFLVFLFYNRDAIICGDSLRFGKDTHSLIYEFGWRMNQVENKIDSFALMHGSMGKNVQDRIEYVVTKWNDFYISIKLVCDDSNISKYVLLFNNVEIAQFTSHFKFSDIHVMDIREHNGHLTIAMIVKTGSLISKMNASIIIFRLGKVKNKYQVTAFRDAYFKGTGEIAREKHYVKSDWEFVNKAIMG